MKLTFEFNFPCSKCQKPITELDLAHSNYSLTILPNFILKHQTCPKTKPTNECEINFIKDIY